MTAIHTPPRDPTSSLTEHEITVLLVDDQAMIGEAVRRMLAGERDIVFHYCQDPAQAINKAMELSPTVILQDLVMPEIDGLTLVKFFRANPRTKNIPLIVLSTKEDPKIKAEAFALGANDYLVKLPDRIELLARIRYHSKGYINLLQRNEAYEALLQSQQALAAELAEAADYVKSLLPERVETGRITADWRFIPSTSLGGDSFGYHWLDSDHYAGYLLDVCGHGVGAALLSVSVMNVIRSQALADTDFRDPSQVLVGLNEAFQMENQNDMFFTIWYGVFRPTTRELVYASAGHPPAILLTGTGPEQAEACQLRTQNLMIGCMTGMEYAKATIEIGPWGKLFLFSDGVYEIEQADGRMWEFDDFFKVMIAPSEPDTPDLDRALRTARQIGRSEQFEDDFSLLQLTFD